MAGWKSQLQVRDLDARQRLEMTCQQCGHVNYLTQAMICVSPEREFLYLDEVEAEAVCKARGCRGRVRLSIDTAHKLSGFIGGMA